MLTTIERPCECGCGEMVMSPKRFVWGHNMKNNRRNPEYHYHGQRAYKTVKCSECGKRFERRADQLKISNYCSPSCANKVKGRMAKGRALPSKRTGKTINCVVCGKEFYVSGSRIRNGAKFCSNSCMGKWQIDHPRPNFIGKADNSGEKNGRYKHGKRVGEHISKQKVRSLVIERDGNWCLICGRPPKGLHLHRVIYGAQGGKYQRANCVQLCGGHHDLVHSNKRHWQPILLEYIRLAEEQDDRRWVEEFRQKHFSVIHSVV